VLRRIAVFGMIQQRSHNQPMANFYNRFLESVCSWPNGTAVEVQHQNPAQPIDRYTFAEMRQISDGVARWLAQTRGTQPGTHCALLASNGPGWVAVFLGTLAAGNVVVPLDTALNAEQVRKLLSASDSSLLVADAKHQELGRRATEGLPVSLIDLEDLLQRAGMVGDVEFPPAEVPGDEVAAILYSSGTTGDPKGVMLTHDNFAMETEGLLETFTVGSSDSILGILPLFHAFALVVNLLLPMAGGARVVFLESFNTTDLLRALPTVNIFACVPQFFYLIHEKIWKEVNARGKLAAAVCRLLLRISRAGRRFGLNPGKVFFRKIHALIGPNMRYLATGGSRFDAEIGHEFEALGFTMLQGYGLTETTGDATYTPLGAVNIASVGRPLPGLEIKILNPQQLEAHSGPAVGEVLMRGGVVMKGYYKRPDATEAALKEGWLYTGDLGYVDTHGNLMITGRAKEVIVLSSGKNVYPEEIEAHYLKTPLIKELCVIGLQSKPGEPIGERLHGVIVANFDELKARKIVNSREALRYDIENLSVQLPSTKRILSYEFWQEDLPRTTTRKIKRFEVERRVRERLAAGEQAAGEQPLSRKLTDEDREWMALPDVQRALAVICGAATTRKAEIYPADNLELDLGLDSMERVELLVALERELGGDVDDSVITGVYTVRDLVEAVRNSVGAENKGATAPAWEELLRQEPTDPQVLAVTRATPVVTTLFLLVTRLAHLLSCDFFRLKIEGLEKLPREGPFIIAPNHQSFLDPPILVSALPRPVLRNLFYVGTSDIFGNGVWRFIARLLKLIPVDPDANLVPAMQAAAFGLRHGKVLVLYPEGERSIDGTPRPFKKGAAILAAHLKVPIYPVALDGFYEAWPRGRKFQKFTRTRIIIGDPILPPAGMQNPEQAYDTVTNALRSRVVAMWDKMHEQLYPHEEHLEPIIGD
jgi:long-chain acyl-CoA synthetase